MNVKSLLGINSPISPISKSASVDRPIKSEASNERDANGQEFYSKQQKKEKMTAEQFQKALALLQAKPFMKEMNWVATAFEENGIKYAWVQDPEGKTIRKIAEFDLWEVFDPAPPVSSKGQLLKKTA